MAFHVGQKVVCVDGHYTAENRERELTEGAVYTIRFCGVARDYQGRTFLGVRLVGLVRDYDASTWGRSHPDYLDFPFRATRFRPIVETKTDISVFQAMLTPKKERVRV